jgi:prostaglandin-endoperoxide synthase 2
MAFSTTSLRTRKFRVKRPSLILSSPPLFSLQRTSGRIHSLTPNKIKEITVIAISPRFAFFLMRVSRWVKKVPGVRRLVSTIAIEGLARTTKPRPRAFSMACEYTTWQGLTNRRYTGRHLPPAVGPDAPVRPSEEQVLELFKRSGEGKRGSDTSVLFVFFAQWFTDSFLRTDWFDKRKNTSNHEIDFCQIYGLSEAAAKLLRKGTAADSKGGLLASQIINGEEFPPFLFTRLEDGSVIVAPEFAGLHAPEILGKVFGDVSDEAKLNVFASGLEHGNSVIGNVLLNVLFLREHNRIARLLAAEYPAWDDDRLFETARNVMIVLLLKLVIEDYIVHIGPYDFPLEAVPFIAEGKVWNKSNWISIEFALLYRWHQLVPNQIIANGKTLEPAQFRNNNGLVLSEGVGPLIDLLSRAPAGKIGLHNTPAFLSPIEKRTIALMRSADLASFNDYREAFSLPRMSSFEQLTADTAVQAELKSLYGTIDKLEWYVGIFAEDYPDFLMMGPLLSIMVAYDAFTQALTNPLLARDVYNEATFSKIGLKVIEETKCLSDIVERNVGKNIRAAFSLPD